MRKIAIIPARSGSKGLKDKNIKDFNGKPLIAYTIEEAKRSQCFEHVIVSTDSEKYADVSRKYGAEVPFLRSNKNSEDTASSWDVVVEVLKEMEKQGEYFDVCCLLQPTSPLRTNEDICNALHIMKEKNADAVISVCEAEHSPCWYNMLPPDHCLKSFMHTETLRRQDLDIYYRVNGAIYWVKTDLLQRGENVYGEKSYAYIMPRERSVDIDIELDFKMAEFLMKSEKR